jgi:hypothetical protein
MANEILNENIAKSELKPIFSDGTAIAVKIKSAKNEKGAIEKEGQIEIIFLDMMTQMPLGEFVIGRITAKELINGLANTLTGLEKELASKEMPKPPQIKPTGEGSGSIR